MSTQRCAQQLCAPATAAQSASIEQPVGAAQTPVEPQKPERHTVAPVAVVHGPSPFLRPHALSVVSQTPAWQTALPTAVLHAPVSGGVCPLIVGTDVPFGSFAVHVFADVSQNWVAAQSPSTVHAPGAWQTPDTEQPPERQTVAPVAVVHGPSPSAKPHLRSGSQTALRQTMPAVAVVQAPSPFL